MQPRPRGGYRGGGGYNPNKAQTGAPAGYFPPQVAQPPGFLPPRPSVPLPYAQPPPSVRPVYNKSIELAQSATLRRRPTPTQAPNAAPQQAQRTDATARVLGTAQNAWFFTPDELAATPSVQSGMSVAQERAERRKAVRFLDRLARSLRLSTVTKCTAIVYLQRFYMRHSLMDIGFQVVAGAAIWLAGKTENDFRRLKDVLSALAHRINVIDPSSLAPSLLATEQSLLLTLNFDMTVLHPFAPMLELAEQYRLSQRARELAWIALVDSFDTELCLRFPPSILAAAVLFAVTQFMKEDMGTWGDKKIWDAVKEMEGGEKCTELTVLSVARELHEGCKVLVGDNPAALVKRPREEPVEAKPEKRAAPIPAPAPAPPQLGGRTLADYSDMADTAAGGLEEGEI